METRKQLIVTRLILSALTCLAIGLLAVAFGIHGTANESLTAAIAAKQGEPAPYQPLTMLVLAGFVLMLIGAVLLVIGIAIGLSFAFKLRTHPHEVQNVKVMSRYALNDAGEMVFSNFEYEAGGGKMYVQLMMPNQENLEFQTSWGVFLACGEGMTGNAIVQGDWLTSFHGLHVVSDRTPPGQ